MVRELRYQHHRRLERLHNPDLAHVHDHGAEQQRHHNPEEIRATVPVSANERQNTDRDSILVSHTKLDELARIYQDLLARVWNTYTIWCNLSNLPESENVYVVTWMLSVENYDVNHFSVT